MKDQLTSNKNTNQVSVLRIFREVFLVGLVSLALLILPPVLGSYRGYLWGFLTAILDLGIWFYVNHKYFGKRRLALSTRLIWILILVWITAVAVYEGKYYFHY